jgi:hypothetical protein
MSPSSSITPFRAGRRPGEKPAAVMPPDFGASVVLAADLSEFQMTLADKTYIRNFSEALIIRAAYGDAHDDRAWFGGARRDTFWSSGGKWLGIYQYIVAGQDITAQAREFCRLIGKLNPGEDVFADIEEGSGNLQKDWQTWAGIVNGELGWAPSDYSGEFFAASHGLQPVDWIAAYQGTEPSVPHRWWQFTDNHSIPGVGVADCSVFHGTIDDLRATAFGGAKPAPQPVPVPPSVTYLTAAETEAIVAALPVLTPGITDDRLPAWYVRRVQAVLNDVYGASPKLSVDGVYGAASQAAVKTLIQKRYGLTQDGVVGKDTWTAIVTAA